MEKLRALEKQLEEEQNINDWAVKLQRASRSGRLRESKKGPPVKLVAATDILFSLFWKTSVRRDGDILFPIS
jgi:hypothetical protein